MSLMIPKVGVQQVFPPISRPITMSRVGEFRTLVDRHRRSMIEATGNANKSQAISRMENNARMVKVRLQQKLDLIA
tara:strand:+ start:776 stop:1003 length:228 start_codon:yes stop_codon:yes gene_type:complete